MKPYLTGNKSNVHWAIWLDDQNNPKIRFQKKINQNKNGNYFEFKDLPNLILEIQDMLKKELKIREYCCVEKQKQQSENASETPE